MLWLVNIMYFFLTIINNNKNLKFLQGFKISYSFYSCGWEKLEFQNDNLNIKNNKMINFCIMQSQKPINITGGPFYILSLEKFKSVSKYL